MTAIPLAKHRQQAKASEKGVAYKRFRVVRLPNLRYNFPMDQKDKALKIAVTAVVLMAVAMFAYYWVSWRTRKTENDVNFSQKVETTREEKAEFAGTYSATDPVEGQGRRLNFFTLNRKEDGSGYFGTAKVDLVAATQENPSFLKCNDVNIGDKDFFIKCSDAEVGQISFVGEWQRGANGIQVTGKVMWIKDGAVVTDKATSLTHSGS